ncbi:PriCT-2 domain-containing protein [Paraburkholderia sp. A3BS-1L]|uniref:PriCT-2 domain-containing protein n=1 Tax=Paraburkholderia sp. A3BS-1L TaxID=3028375 RepID=UPI003DA89BDB
MSARYLNEAERVRAALATIPAEDYVTWVDMAFALRQGFGEAGFAIWDEWSRSAHNYSERAARVTWRSARESGGKTLASLFWLARQHGFDPGSSCASAQHGARGPVQRTRLPVEQERQQAQVRSRRAAVAREALAIWRWARPVGPAHPYLERKQVRAVPSLRELEAEELHALLGYVPRSAEASLAGRVLLAPVHLGEALSTLEMIDAVGRKSALAGGARSGGCWRVAPELVREGPGTPILIAEGVATALSAWQATGWFAVAALSCANLRPVAAMWRGRYPQAQILVLADLGAGHEHARQAALGTSSLLAEPRFDQGAHIAGETPTDFNDMAVLSGMGAIGELLREVRGVGTQALANRCSRWPREAHKEGDEMGNVLDNVRDNVMGNAKEQRAGDGDEPAQHWPLRCGAAIAQAPQARECAAQDTDVTAAGAAQQAWPEAVSPQSGGPEPEPGPASQPAGAVRLPAGEPLFSLEDVPWEIRALAQLWFGAQIRMATPRENGGPYRGEVFSTASYMIQEVATRSVVFHAKAGMEFVSGRLRWMDEHQRLNAAEVQVAYDGARPRVYPWDRARDQLYRTVASLKKSAHEAGFGEALDATLDQLQAVSWARVRQARAVALAQSRQRTGGEPAGARQR